MLSLEYYYIYKVYDRLRIKNSPSGIYKVNKIAITFVDAIFYYNKFLG
jgi:hypothetical protein